MREIVIVISDLYLGSDLGPQPHAPAFSAGASAAGVASPAGETGGGAPSIGRFARFGDKHRLADGWRAWVARWLGLPQCAGAAPASVAAAAASVPAGRTVWIATPLRLLAGLTTVHFDRRSLLQLPATDAQRLAASFADTFRGSGLDLHPIGSGELLLSGPADMAPAITTEPARLLLKPFADSLPAGEGAVALRRLGAEIEMWLHAHPLNEQRMRRGAPPVSTLWLWGGGLPVATRGTAAQDAVAQEIGAAAYGSDAYLQGLWRIAGGEARPQPVDWAAVIGEARAPRALCVVEVAGLLQAHSSWSLADAVAAIDRELLAPSLAALRRRELDRLVLLANDHCSSLRAAHFWRFWRHVGAASGGIEGLA